MNMKSMLSPVKIAVLLAVLLVVWLLIGDKKQALDEPPAQGEPTEQALASVEVKRLNASAIDQYIVAEGQLAPWQAVTVTAQVAGRVTALKKLEGSWVNAGEVLLTLSDEGRSLKLEEAKALIALREQELASGLKLESSKFLAETERKRLQSALVSAKADLKARQLEVQYANPEAPFTGVVNKRHVDVGAYVTMGAALMDVVDTQLLRVKAHIPQQQVARLDLGQKADVTLLDGRKLQGELSFISAAADSSTRTYAIEVTVKNPERARLAGASATIKIHLPTVNAHRISPALLHLDGEGQLGVYAVDKQGSVVFHQAKNIQVDNEAATVQGLPDSLRVISLGAGFVKLGQKVSAVEAK